MPEPRFLDGFLCVRPVTPLEPGAAGHPESWQRFMRTLGAGDLCNGAMVFPPEEVLAFGDLGHFDAIDAEVRAVVCFAKSFQGDYWGWRPGEETVYLLPRGVTRFGGDYLDAQLAAPDFSAWLETWRSGAASKSIRTPWFMPRGSSWEKATLAALSGADSPVKAQDALARALGTAFGAIVLTRSDGADSTQQKLHLPELDGMVESRTLVAKQVKGATDSTVTVSVPPGTPAPDLARLLDDELGWLRE